ncbi:hypothetical protein LZL60_19935, partial [Pseudomonas aeruginosa]|nr:hypothetical protein [Pseudomonas aeruginosa]
VAWMGYDNPRSLGDRETGGGLALPIWINYMSYALKGEPQTERQPPEGVVQMAGDWAYEEYANGQGVALARPSLARAWLAEGRLVVLFPLRSAPTHHYHLRSHQASPASQRFAAWLAAICREAVVQGREFLPAADD